MWPLRLKKNGESQRGRPCTVGQKFRNNAIIYACKITSITKLNTLFWNFIFTPFWAAPLEKIQKMLILAFEAISSAASLNCTVFRSLAHCDDSSPGGLYRKNEDKVDLICIHFYCSHHRRDYKSEYKQRFRPFSQYEYLDGRFVTNANGNGNGQVTPPVTASKIKQQLALQPKATSLHGEPWYREVVELRKQANDYKVCIPYL